jgi:hypothetical protein
MAVDTINYSLPTFVSATPSLPCDDNKVTAREPWPRMERVIEPSWKQVATLLPSIRTALGPYYWSSIMCWATIVTHNRRHDEDSRDGVLMQVTSIPYHVIPYHRSKL